MGWADRRRSAVRIPTCRESGVHRPSSGCSPRLSHRPRLTVRLCSKRRAARHDGGCGDQLATPTYPARHRWDVPDSTDRVCVERRVSKPHRLGDLCPQIVPPSRSSIAFLLPFALCAAFPRSDYYGSSALGGVPLRPLRLAQFRTGRTPRVPVFRSSTFVSLGGELYPWRCRRRPRKVQPSRARYARSAVGSYQPHRSRSQGLRRHHGMGRQPSINTQASNAHFVISPWTLR